MEIPPEHSQQPREEESGTTTSIRKASGMAWNAITSLANGITSSIKTLAYTGKAVSQPITKMSPNAKRSVLAIIILLNVFIGLLLWDIRRLKQQGKTTSQEQDVERLLRKLDKQFQQPSDTIKNGNLDGNIEKKLMR